MVRLVDLCQTWGRMTTTRALYLPVRASVRLASSATAFTSPTPESVALNSLNVVFVRLASNRASVVFPHLIEEQ